MIELKKNFLKIRSLSWKEKFSAIEIILIFMKIKLIVDFLPLKSYFKFYFIKNNHANNSLQHYSKDIYLIKRIKKILPWDVTCLMESMTIHKYLRKYNIIVPIHLGVDKSSFISAHAWPGELNRLANYHEIQIK